MNGEPISAVDNSIIDPSGNVNRKGEKSVEFETDYALSEQNSGRTRRIFVLLERQNPELLFFTF